MTDIQLILIVGFFIGVFGFVAFMERKFRKI